MSGWKDILRQVYVLQIGANDFINKPFQENDFLARALNLIQTKRKQDKMSSLQGDLKRKAETDKLTGLWNRHYIDEYSIKIVQQAISNDLQLSLLVIDIDNFKKINDVYGHTQGDLIIQEVSRQLSQNARDTDIIGRWGGEEFIILLPRCDSKTAENKAELIRSKIESLNPGGLTVTVSIGISSLTPKHNDTFKSLFKRADNALYQAKSTGRNRVCIVNLSAPSVSSFIPVKEKAYQDSTANRVRSCPG